MNILLKSCILGIGAIIQGSAMALFLFPHLIPSGGAASVGVLFNYLLNVPFAISLWILNACLLLAATKWLGKSSALWTMYCVTVTSATVNLITPAMIQPISHVLIDLTVRFNFLWNWTGYTFSDGCLFWRNGYSSIDHCEDKRGLTWKDTILD